MRVIDCRLPADRATGANDRPGKGCSGFIKNVAEAATSKRPSFALGSTSLTMNDSMLVPSPFDSEVCGVDASSAGAEAMSVTLGVASAMRVAVRSFDYEGPFDYDEP